MCVFVCVQVSHKLWVRALASLDTSVKAGKMRNKTTGKIEPAVDSLLEVVSFCDKIIRKEEEEDEGKQVMLLAGTIMYCSP